MLVQAPEDGTDVVTAAKRVITDPGLNTLGLKDKRDITRLVAQSALQVSHSLTRPQAVHAMSTGFCLCVCLCVCVCVCVCMCMLKMVGIGTEALVTWPTVHSAWLHGQDAMAVVEHKQHGVTCQFHAVWLALLHHDIVCIHATHNFQT